MRNPRHPHRCLGDGVPPGESPVKGTSMAHQPRYPIESGAGLGGGLTPPASLAPSCILPAVGQVRPGRRPPPAGGGGPGPRRPLAGTGIGCCWHADQKNTWLRDAGSAEGVTPPPPKGCSQASILFPAWTLLLHRLMYLPRHRKPGQRYAKMVLGSKIWHKTFFLQIADSGAILWQP